MLECQNAKFYFILYNSGTFLEVMFQELGNEERNAVLSLMVINLPYEYGVNDHKLGTLEGRFVTWRDDFLAALNRELQLPDHSSEDFLPLVSHKYIESKEEMQLREEMSLPSICTLRNADLDGQNFLAYLLIDLIELRKFDSRGSVLFRNIIQRMKVSPQEGVWLTSQMAIFLAKRCEEISHIQQKQKDKYRYAKIGAVAVGAGAIVFVTAGLAAPAVAGALIMLGTGTAAAAGIASGLVVIFGGTAAGLAGYKMNNRTRGLTDFEFKQYDEKGKMEVVVMVSGWMEEDEDDKRTFGVLPEQMSLKERLTRFYRCHDPDRLSKVANEVECFEDDPEPLFDQIREQYGLDPLQEDTLVPASLLPPGVSAEEGDETKNPYAQLFAACFEQLAASAKAAEERTKKEKEASSSGAAAPATARHTHPPSQQGTVLGTAGHTEDAAEKLPVASLLSVGDGTEEAVEDAVPAPDPVPESEAERLRAELERIEQEKKEAKDVHLVDEFPYWHWRELTVSPMYELTLLHWEKQLQKDLGKSILNIIKLFSGYAVGTAIQFTLLRALAASLTMPLMLIQLTDVIDNLWLIAAERAEVAGKEMAKALLLRPHGSRPVTLVGYSMGCRVIFSCLKELARRLEELEDPAIAEVVLEPPQEEGASKPAKTESVGDTPTGTGGGDQGSAPADKKEADAVEGSSSSYFSAFTGMFGSRTKAKHETTEAAVSDTGATKQSHPAADETAPEVEAKAEEKDAAEQNASAVRTVRELRGLIKDVVLLGAPLNLKSRSWPRVRRVVSGRLINGYSGDDIILSVIYRFERYKVNVCGVAPVLVPGIENVDLSHIVTQHIHYCTKMKEILEELNLASALPHESSYRVWQKEES